MAQLNPPIPDQPQTRWDPNGISRITPKADRPSVKLAYADWSEQKRQFYLEQGADPGPFDYSGLDYENEIGKNIVSDFDTLTFTSYDSVIEVIPQATLAFAAAGSERLFDGSGSYEFEGQYLGSGSPTFSMDAGTLLWDGDAELYRAGSLNSVPAYGARKVSNLAPNMAIWGTATECTVEGGFPDPLGGNAAYRITMSGPTGSFPHPAFYPANFNAGDGRPIKVSAWMRLVSDSGVGDWSIRDGSAGRTQVALTTSWQRFSFEAKTEPQYRALGFYFFNKGDGDVVEVFGYQVERWDGQPVDDPCSEYVDPGTTKYFSNANGNTVNPTTYVVTEADGSPLAEQPSLLSQPALTNLFLGTNSSSTDLSGGIKLFSATVTHDQPGLTGAANTATRIDDQNASGVGGVRVNNVVTALTGEPVVFRCFVRKDLTATSFPLFQCALFGGTAIFSIGASFDLTNGDVVALGNAEAVGSIDHGDVLEICVSATDNNTGNTTTQVELYAARSTTLGGVLDASLTGAMDVLNTEVYAGKTIAQVLGSSPIITAGSTVSQGAVGTAWDNANHADGSGAWYAEIEGGRFGSEGYGLTAGFGSRFFYTNSPTTVSSFDGTNALDANVSVPDLGVRAMRKHGLAYGGVNKRSTVDGVSGADGAFDGTFELLWSIRTTTANASNTISANIPVLIRNIRRYNTADFDEAKDTVDDLMP